MLSVLFVQLALLQSPAAQNAAAQSSASNLVVVVAGPVYLPDGSVRSETVTLPASGVGLVHVFTRKTLCEPASTGATEPADAAFGWRIASQIVARTDDQVVVSVDWKRLWTAGRKTTNGPGGTVQLTLHPGDRIPLDHIPNAAPLPSCRAVGLGLEVRVARTPPAPPVTPALLPLGATPGGEKPVDAELWLTHRSPAGVERVFHQVVRLSETGGRFGFAATPIATSRGELSVEMTGGFSRFRTPAGGEFLLLSLNRVVTGAGLPAAGVRATTSTPVPMPAGQDVLQFDLVAAAVRRGAGGAGAAGGVGGGGRGGAIASVITSGDPAQAQSGGAAVARSGGGGGGRGPATAGATSQAAQVSALLEGHQFSLKLQVRPIG